MGQTEKVAAAALAIRLSFIALGVLLDSYAVGPRYTDVDYRVFSDAAEYVAAGQSPYERSTYRYPPIIAFFLVPNVWFPSFGKIVFSLADIGCCLELLFCRSFLGEQVAIAMAWLWVVNLPCINICTRGSADSLTNYLVLLLTRLTVEATNVEGTKTLLVGAMFGLLVYLRIYPIIYGPAILLHLLTRINDENRGKSSHDATWRTFQCTVKFVATATSVFYFLCSLSYYYYGEPYLQNALLYHLSREDHRHNFSVHYLGVYLSKGTHHTYGELIMQYLQHGCTALVQRICGTATADHVFTTISDSSVLAVLAPKLILFLPQLVLFAVIVRLYAPRNLPVCLLLQTMVFVAYNKVITAQYFTWYLCLLPLAAPTLRHIPLHVAALTAVFWVAALAYWLYQAYQLEFIGQDRFVAVWQASLLFHWANIAAIGVIVYYAPLSIKVEGLVRAKNSPVPHCAGRQSRLATMS
jgi:phosphatidylinositol glycan class M